MTLTEQYKELNDSFSREIVYHLGIDAGFFTEYTYMLNAMLYCLNHRIKFRLYSADANFGVKDGWQDFFMPFCDKDTNPLHHKYNRHAIPSLKKLFEYNSEKDKIGLTKWKLKVSMLKRLGHIKCLITYHHRVLLNQDIQFQITKRYPVPEMELNGDYLKGFRKMVDLTWHLNSEVEEASRALIESLHLPKDYVGCQLRGGDKITEVSLTSPDALVDTLRCLPNHENVFVLTDDYRLFEHLQSHYSDIHWYTLCSPEEHGYINKSFTSTAPEQKRKQMIRFLTSMQLLIGATHFVGSITTGPSLFILKYLWPNAIPQDCSREDFLRAITLRVPERGDMAEAYMKAQCV
jgi:hypothetical protein